MSLYRLNSGNARWFFRRLGLLLMAACATPLRAGDSPSSNEYQIKAAFIYNFAKFVDWPATAFPLPDSPIILAILGDDPVGRDLNAINGKVVGSHPIQVRYFRSAPALQECHILVVLPSEAMELPAIIQSIQTRNILTICNGVKDFARVGAIINLIKTPQDKIRFEINVDAAKRAGIKIQSPLLNLAKIVREAKLPP
jgi:hypothetical protein